MRTKKPIATITYCSSDYLKVELDKLITNRTIDFYAFIEHQPEEDEKKAHKHLFVMPNGQLDTNTLSDTLTEADPKNPTKPFKCMPFRTSRFDDWEQYAEHNSDYLATKGQTRKYHYIPQEFVVSDEDFFMELIHTIDHSKVNRTKFIREAVEMGLSWEQLVVSGQVPVQQYNQCYQVFELLSHYVERTFRNNRPGHDDVTGDGAGLPDRPDGVPFVDSDDLFHDLES